MPKHAIITADAPRGRGLRRRLLVAALAAPFLVTAVPDAGFAKGKHGGGHGPRVNVSKHHGGHNKVSVNKSSNKVKVTNKTTVKKSTPKHKEGKPGHNNDHRGGNGHHGNNNHHNHRHDVYHHYDNRYRYDYGWGWGGAVAAGVAVGATAAAIGSVAYALPAGCSAVEVNGVIYQQCGSVWYQPRYVGNSMSYVVVARP